MKTEDIRLRDNEIDILHKMCGKTLKAFYHDPFMFKNVSSQAIKICTDLEEYYLYSFTEEKDYYGSIEDVAVWSIEGTVYPLIESKEFISSPVNEVVKNILIVNENQRLYKGDIQIYDVWVTRGIVFDFGDHQIAFEKAVWFSEDIIIHKGNDLILQFRPSQDFCNEQSWAEGLRAECSREIITMS